MSQEVSITLKADTREAVKSVKDLEKQVSNLENLEKKGGADNGFLSQDDVKQFRRMSQETERIYRDFFDKLNRVQRDIDKKKRQLEEAQKRGASQSSTGAMSQEIKELEAKRQMLQSQTSQMTKTYNQGQQHQQTIQGYNAPNALSTMLLGSGKQMMASLGLMIGAGFLAKTLQSGSEKVKSDERYMSQFGQRTGYQGDYDKGRKDAEVVGKKDGNAYTASETMKVADTYTSQAGYKSKEDMWERTNEIQSTSRILGVDATELASTYGSLDKQGTLADSTDFKKFKESMVGAIKETGMAGRDREFLKAVDGLASQVGQGQLSLSSSDLQNIIGLQTALGAGGEAGLKGEKGASVISALDAGVKSGNASIDTMLGWGSDYQGISGRYELEMLKAKGIGSEEVQEKLFKNLTTMAGGDTKDGRAYQALFLQDNFGVSIEEATALVDKAHSGDILKGKKKLEDSSGETKAEIEKRKEGYVNSKVQQDEENAVDWENTQKAGGERWRDVKEGAKDLFFSQPKALQWAEMTAVGLGGGMLAGRAGKAVAKKFSSKIGAETPKPKFTDKLKVATKGADKFLKGGSMLAKGAKFVPVVGSALGGAAEVAESKAEGDGWGKALAKGAGSVIGGVAGGALGFIGGGGVASLATGTAGAVVGSSGGAKVGEGIYNFFAGENEEEPKKKAEEKVKTEKKPVSKVDVVEDTRVAKENPLTKPVEEKTERKPVSKVDAVENRSFVKENPQTKPVEYTRFVKENPLTKPVEDTHVAKENPLTKPVEEKTVVKTLEKKIDPQFSGAVAPAVTPDAIEQLINKLDSQSKGQQVTYLKDTFGVDTKKANKIINANEEHARMRALDKEQEIIESRKAIADAEHTVLDKEKKNLDDMKSIMGSESGSSDGSGGGIFSKMWGGLKSFFGFGNSDPSGGGVGGGSPGSSGGVDTSGGKSDFSGNTNAEKTWSFLKSKGFSDAAAAGIMGNLQQESGIDPTKKQYGGGPGRGIMQWEEGGRWDTLTAWAKKEKKDPLALETQLEYMWKEMNGGDSTGKNKLDKKYGGLNGLKSATDTTWAVKAFEDSFERAGKPNYANRNNYANSIYNSFAGKKSVSTKSTWDDNTANVMNASAPGSSRSSDSSASVGQTINVNVSGAIQGLTKENNDLVTKSIVDNLNNSPTISLAYQQRQGIGGKL